EKQIDEALDAVRNLDETCAARFGSQYAPSFTRLQEALHEVRHVVHQLLQKKRETEPDAVMEVPRPAPAEAKPEEVRGAKAPVRADAITTVAAAATDLPQGDPYERALEVMKAGKVSDAIGILQQQIERQPSGRGRFQRKLQLAQLCLAAGKETIAQPLLDDIAAAIETHKLDDWEEGGLVAGALAFLMQSSKKIQGDAKAKQSMFERICRLDPVQALSV
ncbi:MAG TPA: type VI secretion system domain-containing protein, partial [Bryobacteraceae bacterium]